VPIAVDLGKALLEIGAFSEAEDQVKFILTRDPDNRQALIIRAGALLGAGRPQEALALKTVPPGGAPEVTRPNLATGRCWQAPRRAEDPDWAEFFGELAKPL
jgi:hypothetical protein